MKKIINIALAAPLVMTLLSAVAVAQSESRDDVLKQIEAKRAELAVLEKQVLEPAEEDRAAYADYLKQPGTGVTRLLPREVYDVHSNKKDFKGLTISGGGAYYSFSRLTHEYGYETHIGFEQGYLSVGFGGADFGMISKLGDIDPREITLENPVLQFLVAYSPPSELPKARVEQRRFNSPGVTVDNQVYQRRVRAELNTTYLLRSISYGSSDVLVTFRIVRKDSDGSLIIVWKLLKTYAKTELTRLETEP
jgi:hypothetical protein